MLENVAVVAVVVIKRIPSPFGVRSSRVSHVTGHGWIRLTLTGCGARRVEELGFGVGVVV